MRSLTRMTGVLAGLLFFIVTRLGAAGLGMPFEVDADNDDLVTLSVRWNASSYAPGDEVHGTLDALILEGWHINSVEPLDDFTIATTLEIASPALEEVVFEFPAHEERPFDFAGGSVLAVYEGLVEIPFSARRIESDDPRVSFRLYYQACNDQICLPPRDVRMSVRLGSSDAIAEVGEEVDRNAPAGEFTPLSEAPSDAQGGLFSGDLSATFASRGLLLTLVAVFVLGLALNLTPCVYPLIPITVGYFSSQKAGSRMGRLILSGSYVLGIAITYSILGVFSALSGRLFGAWLQSPMVLVFFAVLMIVLAASMFGLYDIQPPQFIMRRAGARGGYAGALTMGLLAGIVAAPCVGPFVISLIALVAQLQSVSIGFLLFFVLALGLGVPFLILGFFSAAANAIPRSGPWLIQVKKAFGFILVALAFYFLRPVVGDEIYRWGIAVSLLTGTGFLVFGKGSTRAGNIIRFVAALILLIAGVLFAIPPKKSESIEWMKYDASLLAQAREEGKPVVIDFYADWCLPCKELDALTFSDPDVIAESTRFVRLKADLTRAGDPSTVALTKDYGILGVPTIVFLDGRGREVMSVRLVGFEKKEPFLERMRAVR